MAEEKTPYDPDSYIPGKELEAAVNVALMLNMPLLVTGEPGTGKTELAYWIAHMKLKSGVVHRFNTKTTSQAKDLFYRYDAIRHFRSRDEAPNPLDYINFEAMGEAILTASEGADRQVVLVDEIDKAPRDFPNDVLFQFEKFAFRIEEATKDDLKKFDFTKISKQKTAPYDDDGNIRLPFRKGSEKEYIDPPFLLLTSNSEKNLPDAFLRRCVFYHISFPNAEDLKKILEKKFKDKISADYMEHFDKIIAFFEMIRDRGPIKKPATAELIRWVESLFKLKVDWKAMFDELEKEEKDRNAAVFATLRSTMPVLLKNKEDLEKFQGLRPEKKP